MPKRAPKSSQDIPSGQNFSPAEVDLPELLDLIHKYAGHRKELTDAIRLRFYADRAIPSKGQGTVWQNVASGMAAYGIIDKDANFTELGRQLYELRHDSEVLHRTLAKHLLFNANGIAVMEVLRDLNRAGEKIDLPTIREALEERGVHTSTANKSISLLTQWLRKANLFHKSSKWTLNMTNYEDILDRTEPEIEALGKLNPSQKAVLKMLAALGPGHYDSSDLRKETIKAYPYVHLNEKQFPKDVLYPLRGIGYVELTKKGGRGWSLDVVPTSKLLDEVTVPLLNQLGDLDPKLRALLVMKVSEIIEKLDETDINVKGLALEALGFKLMRILGLSYLGTRVRPTSGRFEVDLLFHSDRLAYSRWQIQCKNTERVSLDDVAKEVGLTYHLLTSVVVILTRGKIGQDARTYATDVMRKTNLAIALIDSEDVDDIVSNPLRIFDILHREAAYALQAKPLDSGKFESPLRQELPEGEVS